MVKPSVTGSVLINRSRSISLLNLSLAMDCAFGGFPLLINSRTSFSIPLRRKVRKTSNTLIEDSMSAIVRSIHFEASRMYQ